jgi:hypothetical protein
MVPAKPIAMTPLTGLGGSTTPAAASPKYASEHHRGDELRELLVHFLVLLGRGFGRGSLRAGCGLARDDAELQ